MSLINPTSIDTQFPVPRTNNDSQIFRDNFNIIKQNLFNAKLEIDDLYVKVNIENILSGLSSNISESMLDQSLTSKINQGSSVVLGLINNAVVTINDTRTLLNELNQDLLNQARDLGAAITQESTIRQNEIESLAQQIETITAAGIEDLAAVIQTESTARVTADQALAQQITTLAAATNSNIIAAVQVETTARTTADSALAQQITTLGSQVGTNTASIQTETTARTTADSALAQQLNTLAAQVGSNTAAIQTESTARATADESLAQQITTIVAGTVTVDLNPVYAAIQTESTARTTADTALAQQISTLQAGIGDFSAALQEESTVRADAIDGLSAQYSIKTDVAGLISGFGLSSTAPINGNPTSVFGIRADKFYIAPPTTASATAPTANLYVGYTWLNTTTNALKYWSGSAWVDNPPAYPFIVLTSPTVINGTTVQPGVYMSSAMIGELSAAKITSGTLDAARIAANSITADKVNIGYGTSTSGLTINSSGITATNNSVETFKLGTNGTATFSGNISGGNLTVGSSPAINGNRMTGSGARILSNGHFALGNSSRSIVLNDTNFFLNGRVVDASNFSISATPLSFGTSILNDGPTVGPQVGYTIIPWTGWSSMTINYSFTIIPPYNSTTLPSNYELAEYNPNMALYNPKLSGFIGVYLGIGFMCDCYSSLSDAMALNGNYVQRALAQQTRFIGANPGFPYGSTNHPFYLTEGISGYQPVTKSGTQTWIANSNWDNWFLTQYTSGRLEDLVDNNLNSHTFAASGSSQLGIDAYNSGLGSFQTITNANTFDPVYIRNVRAILACTTGSTFTFTNTSTGLKFNASGSVQNLSISTILT
jgi:hypothetical protein